MESSKEGRRGEIERYRYTLHVQSKFGPNRDAASCGTCLKPPSQKLLEMVGSCFSYQVSSDNATSSTVFDARAKPLMRVKHDERRSRPSSTRTRHSRMISSPEYAQLHKFSWKMYSKTLNCL